MTVAAPLPLADGGATASPDPAGKRLWAEVGELLLVGGLTPLLFPISWLLRRIVGLDDAELAVSFVFFWAAYVINDPHFSVTYLLFYRDVRARAFGDAFAPLQRARYILAGFVVPALLLSWMITAIAMKSAEALGWMVQLMFFLVGWHYVKQGFGVLAVLSARRNVFFQPRERWVILGHCFAAWAYAWIRHGFPSTQLEERGVVYTTLPRPGGLEPVALAAFVLSTAAMVIVLGLRVRREGRRSLPLTPLLGLLFSVWVWTVYSNADPLLRYMIPALHSVQYLYFVWILNRNEAKAREVAPHFERSAKVRLGILAVSALGLGFFLFHLAPWALDDGLVRPADRALALGATPFLAGIGTFVNIHHYFMDHVIWRRENPVMRYMRG